MESFNIYISMATEQSQSTGEEEQGIWLKVTELGSKRTLETRLFCKILFPTTCKIMIQLPQNLQQNPCHV